MKPIDRSNLISQIEQKLRLISAHDLQLLAEDFAKIRFPNRFLKSQLIRLGRNVEGQTTKGWPDAFVAVGPHGADAIEATRSRTAWEAHLEEDYEKARTRAGRELVGYIFIGGYPENHPSSAAIEGWVRKFSGLGISEDKITILIGKELAFELAAPEFARLRQDILAIPSSPTTFIVNPSAMFEGNRLSAFHPSEEDYQQNRVWCPPLLETVVQRLEQEQCALVRGHGAVGKTTLAHLFSIHPSIKPFPTYYLDLNRLVLHSDSGGSAKNDLVHFSGQNITFIIDNVHLDEGLTNDLVQHWQSYSKREGSRLFLLGREIGKLGGTSLAGIHALVLRAGRDALRGVVDRLLRRIDRSSPHFTDIQVDQWIRTFGGDPFDPDVTVDLIAFSAAAEARLNALSRGDHRLTTKDAVDAIRSHYLARIASAEERDNLFRLSALAPLEIALSAEFLPHPVAGFEIAHRVLGVVLADRIGRDAKTFYQLAHPALGQLLIEAFGSNYDAAKERALAARQDVWLGIRIHDRLRQTPEQKAMANVLAHEFAFSDWPSRINSLGALMSSMRRASQHQYVRTADLDQLVAEHEMLRKLYLSERSLSVLRDFNARLSAFPKTLAAVESYSKHPDELALLLQSFYSSYTEDISSFLRSYPGRERLFSALVKDQWDFSRQHVGESPFQPAQTVMALRYFEQYGRPELVDVPSSNLLARSVELSSPNRWGSANLDHLSHFLRMTASAPVTNRTTFLRRVATTAWLEEKYRRNRAGVLSGALFSLSNYLEIDLRGMFNQQALWDRLKEELMTTSPADYNGSTRAMCLLGSCAALFEDALPDLSAIPWPDSGRMRGMIDLYARRAEAQNVGTHELQLWFGFRTMMLWRRHLVTIAPAEGERILMLIHNSSSPTKLGDAVLSQLKAWLISCQQNSWNLVPVVTPAGRVRYP